MPMKLRNLGVYVSVTSTWTVSPPVTVTVPVTPAADQGPDLAGLVQSHRPKGGHLVAWFDHKRENRSGRVEVHTGIFAEPAAECDLGQRGCSLGPS